VLQLSALLEKGISPTFLFFDFVLASAVEDDDDEEEGDEDDDREVVEGGRFLRKDEGPFGLSWR